MWHALLQSRDAREIDDLNMRQFNDTQYRNLDTDK